MKKQWIVIALASLIVSTLGCLDSSLKALNPTVESRDETCDAKLNHSNNFVSSFELKNQKIFKEDFFKLSSKTTINSKHNEILIAKNTELILIVDRDCALLEKSKHTLTSKVVKQVKANSNPMNYTWFKTDMDMNLEDLEDKANKDACVIGVVPNQNLELHALNDPLLSSQSSLPVINHDRVVRKILSEINDEVLVAVVDTGNDQRHPDMAGRHWRNLTEQNGLDGVDDDNNGYVDDVVGYSWVCTPGGKEPASYYHIPHGEHVAGLIAANMDDGIGIAGVAGQKTKIMHLKVVAPAGPISYCDQEPSCLVLALQAIQYAADNKAKVLNISMGTAGRSTAMRDVMAYAVSKGVYIATSAGNQNRLMDNDANFFYPCGYAKDIEGFSCVAATDAVAGGTNSRCNFSNYSADFVELSAPGCDTSIGNGPYGIAGVISTVRAGMEPSHRYMAGTSMASPQVAAAGALVMGYLKTKRGSYPTPALVEDILRKSSRLQANLNGVVQNGRALDLELLFQHMDDVVLNPQPPTTPTPSPTPDPCE